MSTPSLNSTSRLTPIETPDIEGVIANNSQRTSSRFSPSLTSLVSTPSQTHRNPNVEPKNKQVDKVSKLSSTTAKLTRRHVHTTGKDTHAATSKLNVGESGNNTRIRGFKSHKYLPSKRKENKEEKEEDEEEEDEDDETEDEEDDDEGEDSEGDEDGSEEESENEEEEDTGDEEDDENEEKKEDGQDEEKKEEVDKVMDRKEDKGDEGEEGKEADGVIYSKGEKTSEENGAVVIVDGNITNFVKHEDGGVYSERNERAIAVRNTKDTVEFRCDKNEFAENKEHWKENDGLSSQLSAMFNTDTSSVTKIKDYSVKDKKTDNDKTVSYKGQQENNEDAISPKGNKQQREQLKVEMNLKERSDIIQFGNEPLSQTAVDAATPVADAQLTQPHLVNNKEANDDIINNATEELCSLSLKEKGNKDHSNQGTQDQILCDREESNADGNRKSSESYSKGLNSVDINSDSSAASSEGKDITRIPTRSPNSSKSRNSITSRRSSRESAADRALSQETLDDVLARETLEDAVTINSQADSRHGVPGNSSTGIIKPLNDIGSASSDKAGVVRYLEPGKNEGDAVSGSGDDINSCLLQVLRTDSLPSLTEKDNKLKESQLNYVSNKEDCVSDDMLNEKKFDDTNESDVEFKSYLKSEKEIKSSFDASSTNEGHRASIDDCQIDNSGQEKGSTKNSNNCFKNEIREDSNDVPLSKSATTFDDSVETSYFAMFGSNAYLALSDVDQAGYRESKQVTDRPVVQNIVNDFFSDSQTDTHPKSKTSSSLYAQSESRGSISRQTDIDSWQTDDSLGKNCPEKISDSNEKDKSRTNFIPTPKPVIGGSGENLDNQSVTASAEKHEGNGEDNYVVMDTSIVLETEITPAKPLITLSSTNQTENTSVKPKQTFVKEPQFQEINRGDNNKSDNKTYPISMDTGMKQKSTIHRSSENASNPFKLIHRVNGTPERFESQKRPFYSQVRSKYSPSTFSPPQELRAIDRIRLGPYSHSIRSPKDKSSTRKTPSKIVIKNDNRPATHSSVRSHDTNNANGSKKAVQKHAPHRPSPNKTIDTKKLSSQPKFASRQEKHNSSKGWKESNRLKEDKSSTEAAVMKRNDKTTEDFQEPVGEENISGKVFENPTSIDERDISLLNKGAKEESNLLSLEPMKDAVDLKHAQTSESTESEKSGTYPPLPSNENMELKDRNENIVAAESNISKTNGSMLKAVSDQNIRSYVEENSVQETSLNEVNSFAEPTGQEESSIEQQNKVLVEKSLTDTKHSAAITTTSNDKPVFTATSINSNNIVITTTPVSPSSSKSDGNDIILDKVVVHTLTDSKNVKPMAKLKRSKTPSPIITPTTVIIEDETTNIDKSTKTKAGQVVLSSIQKKIREKSFSASLNSVSSVPIHGTSPSPESSLGNSASSKTGILRPAVKTTSMSSLTVPHGLAGGIHPSSPEEDNLSLTSRRDSARPSFDTMSRKSVDYRIRTTATVIQAPGEAEKSKSMLTRDESYIKGAIPYLPLSLAVTCLMLNIFLPGLGEYVSICVCVCVIDSKIVN